METLKAGKTKLICMMGGAIRYNKTVTENFKQPIKVLLKTATSRLFSHIKLK